MFQPRFYRELMQAGKLVSFEVVLEESDLWIAAERELKAEALEVLKRTRLELESYIALHPDFEKSFIPVETDAYSPDIVKAMAAAADKAGVGPMAAVAGAISEAVGRELLKYSEEVIVENGGDIFIKSNRKRSILIFAGDSKWSNRAAIVIDPESTPLGVCTSSGTVGHSFSFGKADAVVTLARDTALADAYATAIGNRVKSEADVEKAAEESAGLAGLSGVVIVCGDKLAARGEVEVLPAGGIS